MELLIIPVVFLIVIFALWTVACLVLKGMFKIADKIFGL